MGLIASLRNRFALTLARGANALRVRPSVESAESYGDLFGGRGGGFAAAKVNRLTEGWNPGQTGPNRLFAMDGMTLRNRARELYLNNPMAKSAVDAFVANVIETGITPSPKFKDVETRRTWRKAWDRWGGMTAIGGKECDVSGDLTIYELQALWLTEIVIAGGCLMHFAEMPRRGRTLPLAVELIPEERFNETLTEHNGNQVVNGIEIDAATGATLAYHVWRVEQNDVVGMTSRDEFESLRLPASQCEYGFFKRRIGQKRGHTLLHAAILHLWALGYYTDNELLASNIKSSWAYMVKTSAESVESFDWAGLMDSDPETGTTDIYGNKIDKHQPGMIFRGAPGDDIAAVGPNVPQTDSLPWIQLIQRSIAVGTGQTYEEVTGDYSQSNFANARCSRQTGQRRYRAVQAFTISHFSNPTWSRFAFSAVRAGLDGFPAADDMRANVDEWLDVKHFPATWESVSPYEDSKTDKEDLLMGKKTLRQVVESSREISLEEHLDEIAEEQTLIKSKGIVLPTWTEQAQEEMFPDGQSETGTTTAPAQKKQPTKRGAA